MRIRTMPEAVAELKKEDPDCAITYWTLRRMINDGTVPARKVGAKALVDLDELVKMFVPKQG